MKPKPIWMVRSKITGMPVDLAYFASRSAAIRRWKLTGEPHTWEIIEYRPVAPKAKAKKGGKPARRKA